MVYAPGPAGPSEATLGQGFSYHRLLFEIGPDDVGDQVELRAEKASDQDNSIWVDYMVVVPLSSPGLGFPQDLAHNAMRKPVLRATLLPR